MRDVVINGVRYSAADVQVAFLGRVCPGVVELSYKESQDVNPVRVVGNRKSVGHVRGNYNVEGSITLLMEEVLGLQVSGKGSVLDLKPFTITVGLFKDGIFVKEAISNVVFKENDKQVSGGNAEGLRATLPFFASEIKPFKG
ncbi:MAG: hypothetical protein M9892_03230 [Bacteroidetes bacterium]|nr:hypothetical protein [Bacteroidota bacterium]